MRYSSHGDINVTLFARPCQLLQFQIQILGLKQIRPSKNYYTTMTTYDGLQWSCTFISDWLYILPMCPLHLWVLYNIHGIMLFIVDLQWVAIGNESMVMLMRRTRSFVWKYLSKMRENFFPRLDFHFPWEAVGRIQYCMVLYQCTTTQYCIESSLAAITHL